MLPFITVFDRDIPMYGLMIALGCIFGVIYLKIAQHRHKELEADSELALVYSVVGAFVGGKVLYLLTVLPQFISDLPYLFSHTNLFFQTYLYGGFVFFGGLLGAVGTIFLYCYIVKINSADILQLLLPMLPLIHSFGRIGCLMAGCCYGREAVGHEWGILLRNSTIAPTEVPLIPVQLYEAVLVFFIFVLLAVLARKNFNGKGMLCVYLISYGIIRFVLEFYRGDAYRGYIGHLSVSQVIAILCVLVSVVFLLASLRFKRQSKDEL